jgi:hypothetical protein
LTTGLAAASRRHAHVVHAQPAAAADRPLAAALDPEERSLQQADSAHAHGERVHDDVYDDSVGASQLSLAMVADGC